jgi:GT2 family glycosyltransferase
MPGVSAANLSMPRELFWMIGGFDEDFPLAGAEDQDLSLRARAADALLLLDTEIHCFHNDHYLSRRAFCDREERSARTMPFLVRKHTGQLGDIPYARENRPIEANDPTALVAKKLIKTVLATRPILELLHVVTRIGEAMRAPEKLLRRLYDTLLAVHVFRGFRQSWGP